MGKAGWIVLSVLLLIAVVVTFLYVRNRKLLSTNMPSAPDAVRGPGESMKIERPTKAAPVVAVPKEAFAPKSVASSAPVVSNTSAKPTVEEQIKAAAVQATQGRGGAPRGYNLPKAIMLPANNLTSTSGRG